MPGGESRSNYVAIPSEGPGQLYLEDEDGPFYSKKPALCESQISHLLIQVDLTPGYSRKPSVLLGVHRRNMLFRPLDGPLRRRLISNPAHIQILPNRGPSQANQHLPEPRQGSQERFGKVHPHRQLRVRRASAQERRPTAQDVRRRSRILQPRGCDLPGR